MSVNWSPLTSSSSIAEIITRSNERPQVIFKHSTRCSISIMAKSRLDKADINPDADFHYLDLLSFRSLSNEIADQFQVHHESPQILIIKNGECIFDESHNAINMEEIGEMVKG